MKKPPDHRGFTVIELILTIVVGAIVALMVSPLLSQGFHTYFVAAATTDLDSRTRLAMERMSREIREIENPTTIDIPPDHSRITFFRSGEGNITYRVSDGKLVRIVSLGSLIIHTDLLAENCHNPVFRRAGNIVSFRFDLDLRGPEAGTNQRFQSAVFLRNS